MILPHVTIAHGGHSYDGPPKSVGYGIEISISAIFISKKYRTGEDDHPCEHRIYCAGSSTLDEGHASAITTLTLPALAGMQHHGTVVFAFKF